MTTKILVAVGDSEHSQRAIEYVGTFLQGCEREIEITVYHVLEIPPMLLEHGGTEESKKEMENEFEEWQARERTRVDAEIFAVAEQSLKEKGLPNASVRVEFALSEAADPDVAFVILQKVKDGGFDTVVLGNRSRSPLKDFVFGTVTFNVIHRISDCTIWVVN